MNPPRDPRRHDLDALRAIAMLAGIWLHASMAYFAIPIWPVQDPQQAAWLETVFHGLHGFRMPLFMLISGFFTCMLWRRRGLGSLIRHRLKRIGLPMLLSLVTVIPLMTWVSVRAFSQRFGSEPATASKAAASGDIETLRGLLAAGTLPDSTDKQGTPLITTAALFGQTNTVQFLLDAGADPNARGKDGGTPLIAAAFLGQAGAARLLIDAGADLEARNNNGDTAATAMLAPWDLTAGIAKMLYVPVERDAVEAGRKEVLAMLGEAGLSVDIARPPPPEGGLWRLAAEGKAGEIKEAVAGGAAVDERSPDGLTPLTVAVLYAQRAAARQLLADGATVAATNADGGTPLHAAALLGRTNMVRLLLRNDADPLAENAAGRTPVDVSRTPADEVQTFVEALKLTIDADSLAEEQAYARELMGFPDGEEAVVAGSRDEATGDAFDANARAAEIEENRRRAAPSLIDRVADLPKTHASLFGGSVWHHLWFLNFLMWLVAGFAVYALIVRSWRPPAGLVMPAWRLLWLIPVTAVPAWWMGTTFPVFGPDTSAGWLPAPIILAYYAVFFGFGAWLYDADDRDGRVGRCWWLSLPLALLVIFPAGLEMTYGHWGYRNEVPQEYWHAAAVVLQVTYAWLMSFGLMGLFRRFFSGESRTMRYVSDASYWLYLLHLPAVVWVSSELTDWQAPAVIKLLAVIAAVVSVLLLIYQLAVRYTWIGAILNGRKRRPAPSVEVV